MPAKREIAQEIYQIKITLLGTRPPIWRRLLVPGNLTLEQLHRALQLAMDWQDSHLHEFSIGKMRYGTPDPDEALLGLDPPASERATRLCSVLGKVGAKALYTYDFGDGWDHTITVEKILPPEPGQSYPVCIAGNLHAPPEDCGGVPGYGNLLEAIADPRHDEHQDMREWLGGDFDPKAFSVDEINARLALLQRRRRKP